MIQGKSLWWLRSRTANPVFPSLLRQLMFLVWSETFPPLACKNSWYSERMLHHTTGVVKGHFTIQLIWSSLIRSSWYHRAGPRMKGLGSNHTFKKLMGIDSHIQDVNRHWFLKKEEKDVTLFDKIRNWTFYIMILRVLGFTSSSNKYKNNF